MTRKTLTGAVLLALALPACGGEDASKTSKKPDPSAHLDPAKAKQLVLQGDAWVKRGDFDKGRELFDKADKVADVQVRREIVISRELADKKQAQAFADDIIGTTEDGNCKMAIGDVNDVVARGEVIAGFIRKFTGEAIYDCVRKMARGDELGTARTLVLGKDLKVALEHKRFGKLRKYVQRRVNRGVERALEGPLDQRDWNGALKATRKLVKAKEAGKRELGKVLGVVREGILEDIAKLHDEAMGQAGRGAQELKKIGALLELGWPAKGKDKPPKKAARLSSELSLWIACDSVSCTETAVSEAWTYGHQPVRPLQKPSGAPLVESIAGKPEGNVLKTGTRVWKLAGAKGITLIATSDPGDLEGGLGPRAKFATGWVEDTGLRSSDTSKWLPPGASLLNTRVWGPLRKGQQNYELGVVTKVDVKARSATIKRLSDRKEVELPRARLHFGVTDKGQKVLGFCSEKDKLEPAEIHTLKEVSHEQLGDSIITLMCLDAKGKKLGRLEKSQLPSIRTRREWLPPRK